jgi:hypothetical protein
MERPGAAKWVLAGIVAVIGIVALVAAVKTGRQDSALLFVVLPILLAVVLVLMPVSTTHGRVFTATTVVLLLAAVAFHEGAICVVLAAPLVYGVVHLTTLLVQAVRRTNRPYALLPVPLLLLSGIEGTSPALRVAPDQAVEVGRVVAMTPGEVLGHLVAGPHPTALRSVPLRLLGMPTPELVVGDGLDPGDRWLFHYPGSAHGPGGHTVTQVASRTADRIDFAVVQDNAITARWFRWERASIAWQPVDPGHTRVTLRVGFRRGLDPSWYFGPLQDGLMHEGGGHLLDMLGLR